MPFPRFSTHLHGTAFFNIDQMDGCFYDKSYGLFIQVLPAPLPLSLQSAPSIFCIRNWSVPPSPPPGHMILRPRSNNCPR